LQAKLFMLGRLPFPGAQRPNRRPCRAGAPAENESDKLERGHKDVQDATLHTDEKMIRKVYDRRAQKRAKPAA
jgi:hypothetical protein